MRIRSHIFLGILLVVSVGFYFLLDWILDDLTPRYRESTEEPLVDTARILASLAAVSSQDGRLDLDLFRKAFDDAYSRSFTAQIFALMKTEVDFRVYVTDARGTVVFDSRGRDEGEDYSSWRDVRLTLEGRYGARTSRDDIAAQGLAGVMYVAAPIVVEGETVGVLTVGKPTVNANQFIEKAKRKIVIGGAATCFAVIVVSLIVSGMVTRPIRRLTDYAKAIRDGRRVELPSLGRTEIHQLGLAFDEMRDALEGKQYVENYVQTLTHEVKSPLSAIQGAAELLREDMPVERREQFLENIRRETDRIKNVVDKLLLLSSLESKKGVGDLVEISLLEVIREVRQSMSPMIERKRITVEMKGDTTALFLGDNFFVRHAVANLLQNAIEFTPQGGTIRISVCVDSSLVGLVIEDSGPGIPEYAIDRVFERFYSLKRPDTGRKSSGLGLSLVQEVVNLHRGTFSLTNLEQGGCQVKLSFPKSG